MVRWSVAAIIMALLSLASTTTTAPAASLTWRRVHRPTLLFPVGFLGARVPLWSARTSSSRGTSSVAPIRPYPKNLRTAGQKWWMIFLWKKIRLFLVLVQQPRMRRKRCSTRQMSEEKLWKWRCTYVPETSFFIVWKGKLKHWATVSRIFHHLAVRALVSNI